MSRDWTLDELKAECRRLVSLRDRAFVDAERAEAEADTLRALLDEAMEFFLGEWDANDPGLDDPEMGIGELYARWKALPR